MSGKSEIAWRATAMANDNNCSLPSFELNRVYGSSLSQEKRWYALTSVWCGVKVSKFVKGKFFDSFPSEICRTKASDLWREKGECVPLEWFSLKRCNSDGEVFVVTLFGIIGGLLKSSGGSNKSLLSWKTFNHIVSYINNIDVRELETKANALEQSKGITPKTKRISFLEKELAFYSKKVIDAENVPPTAYETPPSTPYLHANNINPVDTSIENVINGASGKITKRRQLKMICSRALAELEDTCNVYKGSLGTVLGYSYLHGDNKIQEDVKSAFSEAVEIVTLNKGVDCGLDLALSKETKLLQQSRTRVPDWVQLYVKLETKLPDDGWQTVLNFLRLGRSGVS